MSSGYEPIDNYEVASFIAGSSSSQVFEVIEPGTNRRLAMKLINNSHPDAKQNKAALKAEAAICKQLDHPNVIHYEGFISGRDHTYMLMEYFRAPTLKVQLKLDPTGVHLRIKKLIDGLCGGLQHLHDRGFIHRDIKPENVLMNKVGEIRLIDFSLTTRQKSGLAAMLGGKPSVIQGTRTYIAPETIRKRPPVVQTDFYSLGILFFEVLTGKTPFQAPTPNELLQKHLSAPVPNASEFNPNVSPEMDRLLIKLLSKKPEQRGKDMAEVAAELRRIRVFKEEIPEPDQNKAEETPANLLDQLKESKLDSRLDAQRSELVRNNPQLAGELARQQQDRQAAAKAKKDRLAEMQRQSEQSRKKGKNATPEAAPAPAMTPQQPPMPFPYPQQPGYPYPMPQMPNAAYPGYPAGMPPYPQAGTPPAPFPPNMPMPQPFPPAGLPPVMVAPPGVALGGSQPIPVQPIPMQPVTVQPVTMQPTPPAAPAAPATAQAAPLKPAPEVAALLKPAGSAPAASAEKPKTPAASPPLATPAKEDELEYMTDLPEIL